MPVGGLSNLSFWRSPCTAALVPTNPFRVHAVGPLSTLSLLKGSIGRHPLAFLGVVAALLLVPARDGFANCQNGAATQNVSAGTTGAGLINILWASTKPCTLNVGPGTYVAPAGSFFPIVDGITLRSTAGSGTTVLQTSAGFSVVSLIPYNGACPTGATLDGFTLAGAPWGVYAGADPGAAPGCSSGQVSNITLRNLAIYSNLSNGHGINLHNVQDSVIDSCLISSAYANGIYLETGSNRNLIMNNRIAGSFGQHAIAIQTSDDNVIVGNTIDVTTAFDGIILNSNVGLSGPGSSRNRIERNTIVGHRVDGIVLTDVSRSNYVGLNVAVSRSYVPGSSTPPTQGSGTGIWVNNGSNANLLFGNDLSGSPENGIDVLTAKSTFLVANVVHGNWQGGIWVANVASAAGPSAPVPQDTVLHGNYIYFNTTAPLINLQNVINTQAAFNYLSAAQGGVLASTGVVAMEVLNASGVSVFENTISEVSSRAIIHGSTTGAQIFRNRFVKGTNIPSPAQADGRNGVTYSLAPASVAWDAGAALGGNHWNEFGASADPDPGHPYTAFIGNSGGGPYVDRYPFASESLRLSALPNSVTVLEPVAGTVFPAQTRKTVRWIGRGCTKVDIAVASGAQGLVPIATGYPNTGYFTWNVPVAGVRNDYYAQVTCTDANGAPLGASAVSGRFTIATPDLVLLNPGRNSRIAVGGRVRVAWKTSAALAGVNIYLRNGAGAETLLAGNVTATDFYDVTIPGDILPTNRASIRIQDAGNASRQDSVDGFVLVRGAATFESTFAGQTLVPGALQNLEWSGPIGAETVDLDLIGTAAVGIARNLPDFGSYLWLVPDLSTATARVRVTFKDGAGNAIGFVDSGSFAVNRNGTAGWSAAARRDIDGDGRTDLAIWRPSAGYWFMRYSSTSYTTASAASWGSAGDVPISGDFDGDGRIDLTVFRPAYGVWFICYSSQSYNCAGSSAYVWGQAGDIPLATDFDGDGRTDLTIWRPSNGAWYTRTSSTGYTTATAIQWGQNGDVPLAGDFDGDRKTEFAVYRPNGGYWYIVYSAASYGVSDTFQWGLPGDQPLTADFDGDGKTDLAVFRPSTGEWFIRYSGSGFSTSNYGYFQWGLPGDVPSIGDYDGDGKADIAIFRSSSGEWIIRYSSLGYSGPPGIYQWGASGDVLLR